MESEAEVIQFNILFFSEAALTFAQKNLLTFKL